LYLPVPTNMNNPRQLQADQLSINLARFHSDQGSKRNLSRVNNLVTPRGLNLEETHSILCSTTESHTGFGPRSSGHWFV
jgi:hypothetical protein